MKPERLQSAAERVVDREQRRDERAIRLIARERAEGRRVAERRAECSAAREWPRCFRSCARRRSGSCCENGLRRPREERPARSARPDPRWIFRATRSPWLQTSNQSAATDRMDAITLLEDAARALSKTKSRLAVKRGGLLRNVLVVRFLLSLFALLQTSQQRTG